MGEGALDFYRPQGCDNSLILPLTALGISPGSWWKVTGRPLACKSLLNLVLTLSIPFEVEALLLGCISI